MRSTSMYKEKQCSYKSVSSYLWTRHIWITGLGKKTKY